jgi:hypothetical protein
LNIVNNIDSLIEESIPDLQKQMSTTTDPIQKKLLNVKINAEKQDLNNSKIESNLKRTAITKEITDIKLKMSQVQQDKEADPIAKAKQLQDYRLAITNKSKEMLNLGK